MSSSKMAPSSPISLCERIVPPSAAAMPADSCPRCWSAYSAKNASRAASRPGAKTPVIPHILCHYSRPLVRRAPPAEDLKQGKEDVDRIEVDAGRHEDRPQSVSAGPQPREIDQHETGKNDERQPRIGLRMDELHEDRDDADHDQPKQRD